MLAGILLSGCSESTDRASSRAKPELPAGAQALSLLGDTLYPPEPSPEVLEVYEANLAQATADYEADPTDADAIIWYGRRTAYLGDYLKAIDIYSEGIEKHPDDARMYRHRGHRYITTRRLDDAIADLETAAELIAGTEDQVEPDGLPNARNIPTGTLQSNIWYHLGLANYLKGDFENALGAYRECMEVSGNPDMQVATSHWLYMTLRRLGEDKRAAAVLLPIHSEMDVIENGGYHRLLLMYKGELTPEELLAEAEAGDGVANATTAYGVGNWYAYTGNPKQAEEVLRKVLIGPQWAAFGYIAAEADMRRLER
jgi:tetratricopeptide (TPR) repeat protein